MTCRGKSLETVVLSGDLHVGTISWSRETRVGCGSSVQVSVVNAQTHKVFELN